MTNFNVFNKKTALVMLSDKLSKKYYKYLAVNFSAIVKLIIIK
ncbi:hypothetical protein MuYL_1114 [Mucilaginibacter xinganensis]|uniref:Uncharacterized protein n=1 Tax=Mucilaginibacter xinganensis TaxID=1234841 RepID=A0A223NTL0_9SPHI|nr:hypothetical protein MuYL_1114 [Mucilaginibacter xinganensis]